MSEYRFLIDRSANSAAVLFAGKRVRTLEKVGLPENASDAEIVRIAWEHRCIMVTANGDDFVREIEKFQRKQMEKECHELYGLVILPNESANQERLMRQLQKKKPRFGNKDVEWSDVWEKNLCVRVKRDGVPEVKRFSRCHYCEKNILKRR